ncbi:MAG: tetratricopeptide repeat protein [Cyanothece sp. SIO1E1]|nr:tetratricopeptide repeat protein [Cyanothece sp. SIO1E1]
MIKLSNALLLSLVVQLAAYAQDGQSVFVQDDARVGLIVTGEGNTLNTTQIFGKSPEYSELKTALEEYNEQIGVKSDLCDEMEADKLPEKYIENCTSELAQLSRRRDSIQKIEKKFRMDVLRLAAMFEEMEVNTERMAIAEALFEQGRIWEADAILKVSELEGETKHLLANRNRMESRLQQTDSLLAVKAKEWLTKALLTGVRFKLIHWEDSVQYYIKQSIKCRPIFGNLWEYVEFSYYQNRLDSAVYYIHQIKREIQGNLTDLQQIRMHNMLGMIYTRQGKNALAETSYLETIRRLENWRVEDQAVLLENKANLYTNLGVMAENRGEFEKAEQHNLEALEILLQLTQKDSSFWLDNIASIRNNLGVVYESQGKYQQAKEQHLLAVQLRRTRASSKNWIHQKELASSLNNLGGVLRKLNQLDESIKILKEGYQIWTRLIKIDRQRFLPLFSINKNNLANALSQARQFEEAEKYYLRAMEDRTELSAREPAEFLPYLAKTQSNLGVLYNNWEKPKQAETILTKAIQNYAEAAKTGATVPKKALFDVHANLSTSLFLLGKLSDLQAIYRTLIDLANQLAEQQPEQYKAELAQLHFFLSYVNLQLRNQTGALDQLDSAKFYAVEQIHTIRAKLILSRMIQVYGIGIVDPSLRAFEDESVTLRDTIRKETQPHKLVPLLKDLLSIGEKALQKQPENVILKTYLASEYNSLAYYSLFIRDFIAAEQNAKRGLILDPSSPWLESNLAPALLLQGKFQEAQAIYASKKGKSMGPLGAWNDIFLEDLQKLEESDITHPDVEKIRAFLSEK